MRSFKSYAAIAAVALSGFSVVTAGPRDDLNSRLDEVVSERPELHGISISVRGREPDALFTVARGVASPEGMEITGKTPFRTASVTKTFVAATVLRLWEQERIDLDAAIIELIDPLYDEMLTGDGYDTSAITLRHLLMHVSGMPDHVGDEYLAALMENTQRQWTAQEQVGFLVDYKDPLGGPGERFEYSDTGYILIGHIIERLTGEALAAVVRQELKFDDIDLSSTWWEQLETPPELTPKRAHQYLDGTDVTDWNGSMDLYGGGGLISTTEDLSRFALALFGGEIFDQPSTLELMMEAPGTPAPENYRVGLFPSEINGMAVYSHGGFWGVELIAIPDANLTAAGVVLDQAGYRDMVMMMRESLSAFAVEE